MLLDPELDESELDESELDESDESESDDELSSLLLLLLLLSCCLLRLLPAGRDRDGAYWGAGSCGAPCAAVGAGAGRPRAEAALRACLAAVSGSTVVSDEPEAHHGCMEHMEAWSKAAVISVPWCVPMHLSS